jgi:hypothetical protein
MKVKTKTLRLVGMIIMSALLIASITVSIININQIVASSSEPQTTEVGIVTKFGCLKTMDNAQTFIAKQKLMDDLVGYHYAGCINRYYKYKPTNEPQVYQGPVRPTDDEDYFRKTGITRPLSLEVS